MTTAAKGVVAFMVLLSLALSACGGDNKNPIAPTPTPAPTPAPPPPAAAVLFQRHMDRPYHQQCLRPWYGDRHDHANWVVAVWYVGYGLL